MMVLAPILERFPAARLHLHAEVCTRLNLPDFAGSALRGAFGQALKQRVCVTGRPECSDCPLYRSCDYPALFETPPPRDAGRGYSSIPHPYVVEPPALGARTLRPGDPLDFSLVLIGPALGRLRLILGAWAAALERGIGHKQGGARLWSVTDEQGKTVLDVASGRFEEPQGWLEVPRPSRNLCHVGLGFDTPVHLRRRGKDLREDEISASDMLMAVVRRTAALVHLQLRRQDSFDWAHLARQAREVHADFAFERRVWRRYSSRQQRSMPMGGLLGACQMHGALEEFWPFIWLGQWLHVGKKCSFGLGRYTVEVPDT